jgi:hypothetical protein
MSKKQQRIFWPSVIALAICLSTLVVVAARRANAGRNARAATIEIPPAQNTTANQPAARAIARNLSLQPTALNVGRRLGKRFSPARQEKSILIGTLVIGGEQRVVRTTRTQTNDGEQVEIQIAGSQASLTWDSTDGPLSARSRPGAADRELIERLVHDSPDQFVLGQLRGASYFTVARNVRPVDAGDNYAGPLWNIVRVDDPERDQEKRPQSQWRLYYINTATGVIDRIVSEVNGQQIVAEISAWDEANGEKVPTEITWTRQGQTLMTYRLTNFSHNQQ